MKYNTNLENAGWKCKGSYYYRSEVDGKTKIEGQYIYYSIPFKFSLASREYGRYTFRGTIRALDSNGNVLKKQGKEAKDILNKYQNSQDEREAYRKLDVRKDIQCAFNDDNSIMECIVAGAERLYLENRVLMGVQLEALTSPDTITPFLAAQMYGHDFITEYHPKLVSEQFERATQKLIRDCKRLPAIPLCKLSSIKMKESLKRVGMGRLAQMEVYRFFNFCLEYGIYEGTNPVEKPSKKRKTGRAKQIKATRPDELTCELQDALYRKIEENITSSNAAVAMFASGIDPKDIVVLKWKDLIFHKEIDDYVVIRIWKESKLSATHDYSRPLVPRSAKILRDYYDAEKLKCGGNMSEKYVFPSPKNKTIKHIPPAAVIENATRILSYIGVGYGILGQLHRENRKMAAARRILFNTYERNIRDVCNLKDDSGTVNYLLGRSFGSNITADSYTSFSSGLGLDRLYCIMRVLRKTENYVETYREEAEGDQVTRVYYPESNKEYTGLTGTIIVPPAWKL